MTYLGCLGIVDPAEERVAAAVAQLGSQIAIWIVTGDQMSTAYYAAIDAGAACGVSATSVFCDRLNVTGICRRDSPLVPLWEEEHAPSDEIFDVVLNDFLDPANSNWAGPRTHNVLAVGPRELGKLLVAPERIQRKSMQVLWPLAASAQCPAAAVAASSVGLPQS